MSYTDWKPCGLGEDLDAVDGGTQKWSNPTNIYADDSSYATVSTWPPENLGVADHSIKLVVDGSAVGANKSAGAAWSEVEGLVSFGAVDDLWEATLTAEKVKSSAFGVAVAVITPLRLISHYLKCTMFDFSAIPDGSAINGIEARFKRKKATNSTAYVNLVEMKVHYTAGESSPPSDPPALAITPLLIVRQSGISPQVLQ